MTAALDCSSGLSLPGIGATATAEIASRKALFGSSPVPVNSPRQKAAVPTHPTGRDHVALSPDQQVAFDKIMDFSMGGEKLMSLIGAAGTGKTTLMRQVATEASKRGWIVILSAPTHKATAQIAKSAGRSAQTVYKALGLTLVENDKDGTTGLKASGSSQLVDRVFLIVDEASMIPEKLLKRIQDRAKKADCRVLFVGDAAQLNPVKELPCKAVDPETCPWQLVELTKIHRQAAENPIIRAATAVRLADMNSLPLLETDMAGELGIQHIPVKREWADLMIQRCAGDDDARYCGYTNKAVDEASQAIRQAKYGDQAVHPYLPGERLIVNERHVVRKSGTGKKRGKKHFDIIDNNTEITVRSSHRDGEMYVVRADVHGEELEIRAYGNYRERKQHLDRLAAEARRSTARKPWEPFWEACGAIADLRSASAMSVHKSQGTTLRDVFLNLDQLKVCRNPAERQRLLYVCLTRASRTVYLTGAIT